MSNQTEVTVDKPRPNVLRLVAHMLAAVFNSRSRFYRQWQAYEAQPKPKDPVAGRWVGEWISSKSGHRGELKCVLTPASTEVYRAHFYATFSKLFRVGYQTDLKIDRTNGKARLKGEENLGALAGGIYRCEGEVNGVDFECTYSCKYDQGVFRLKRLD